MSVETLEKVIMGYEFDVFVSYRKTIIGNFWISKYFAPSLKHELSEILGRDVNVYVDVNDINAGHSWPDNLKRALVQSRCIVPVFSGTYFHSEWCSREFAIMHNRQTKCGLGCITNPRGIIIPILVRDGDHLPDLAKSIQCKPMIAYYTSCEAFKFSPDYMRFESEMMNLADDISKAILSCPEFNDQWFNEEWLNISIKHLYNSGDVTIIENPRLK